MFLIVFSSTQALLLSSLRFLRPRSSRGASAQQARDMNRSRPQTRRFRERRQAQFRARTQTVRVHEQSVSMFGPRQEARRQTVRIRDLAAATTVRKQAFAQGAPYPQRVRGPELSMSATSSLTGMFRELHQAENCSRSGIVVSVSPLTSFPVRIRIISVYVHV